MINHQIFRERLGQLVASPSVSCTSPDLDMSNMQVVELLASWLSELSFNVELLPVQGYPGKANMIATLGQGNNGLVLSGHTDTVPCNPERWQQDPFSLCDKDNRFYGLGATDMKGFFPTVLGALEGIDLKKIQKPLVILATADEESSMSGARALSQSHASLGRYAVIGEPTGLKPIRMHKGIMMEAVRIQGLAAHSSNPELGHNALEAMHKVLDVLVNFRKTIQTQYSHAGFQISVPTLNLGCIHGGDNPNRICGSCELQFDLRPVPGMHLDNLHDEINRLLAPLSEQTGTSIQLERLFGGVPAYEEPANSELVTTAERLSGFHSESVAFATEAPFLQAMGMQTIVMGPGSIDQAHQPNEYIEQSQIEPAIKILRNLIQTLCC